jgi:hypothetical protein
MTFRPGFGSSMHGCWRVTSILASHSGDSSILSNSFPRDIYPFAVLKSTEFLFIFTFDWRSNWLVNLILSYFFHLVNRKWQTDALVRGMHVRRLKTSSTNPAVSATLMKLYCGGWDFKVKNVIVPWVSYQEEWLESVERSTLWISEAAHITLVLKAIYWSLKSLLILSGYHSKRPMAGIFCCRVGVLLLES